jgi:hypothetical protein
LPAKLRQISTTIYGVTPQKRNEFSLYFVKYSLYQKAFQTDVADCTYIYTLPHAVTLNVYVKINVFEIRQCNLEYTLSVELTHRFMNQN